MAPADSSGRTKLSSTGQGSISMTAAQSAPIAASHQLTRSARSAFGSRSAGTVVPFWLVVASLHHLTAAQASVVGMSEPLMATAIAWVAYCQPS